jgi:catechol 2,3-dioxygenase-like lactoylglutathione lyase family enzyme
MAPTAVLRHVSLEVADIARAEWFYDRFLGRLGHKRFVRDAGYLGYTDGTLTLWLIHTRAPRVRRRPPTGDEEVIADHLAFEVGSAGAVQALEVALEREEIYPTFRGAERPEFRPGYYSAVWADPDQTVLEVYAIETARRAKAKPPARTVRKRPAARRRSR